MRITKEIIKDLAGDEIYFRGRGYFLDGMVEECFLKDGILFGKVHGSKLTPYNLKVYFDKNNIHPECDCPYDWGEFCKHSVALLLNWLDGQEKYPGNNLNNSLSSQVIVNKDVQDGFDFLKFIPENKPKIQIWLSTESFISTKGIKIRLVILYHGAALEVNNVKELLGKDYYNFRDKSLRLPALSEYTTVQQHCLMILDSFTQDSYFASEMRLQQFQLSLLLKEIKGEDGIDLFERKRKRQIHIRYDKIIPLKFTLGLTNKDKLRVQLNLLDPDNKTVNLPGFTLIEGRPMWYFDDVNLKLLPFDNSIKKELLFNFLCKENILDFRQIPYFLTSLSSLNSCCEVTYTDARLKEVKIEDALPDIQLFLDYAQKTVFLDLKFVYPEAEIPVLRQNQAEEFYFVNNNSTLHWRRRNLKSERGILEFILNECKFLIDSKTRRFYLQEQDSIFLFLEKLSQLQDKCEIFYSESFKTINKTNTEFMPQINAYSQGIDWFYLDVKYYAEGIAQEVSHNEIRRQLLSGRRYIKLKSGEFIPISKQAFEKAEDILGEYEDISKQLPFFQAPFLMEKSKDIPFVNFDETLQDFNRRLKNFRFDEKIEIPEVLENTLRDYQKEGVRWLEFLCHFHFGGILADEMGLGKTLQVLTMIQKEKKQGTVKPSLVVCPTTLVWNWETEAKKFLPGLKTLTLSGLDRRNAMSKFDMVDLVITSYALLRRDIVFYKEKEFCYVILDEAQNIKNRHTLNARMSKQLKSKYRIVLTGTPLENSIADLWSIFDFVMPSFLNGYDKFRQRYELPILKENDKQRLDNLVKKINPFILRRLKADVVKELPKKIEQVTYTQLGATQLHAYEEMLKIGRNEVVSSFKSQGFNRSRMMILTVLLRLRQICCHPVLAGINLGHHSSASAKLVLLKELLSEALDGGHKILIFSQFVEMLKIIAEYLRKETIVFEYMDGRTKNRRQSVERFNNNNAVRVFLLSLKVGGFGLNLTSADTVIIYEPWWNPAVEEQATDRAHRIGQKKTVVAYKMITKGTIEEKILELQKKKKHIFDSLIISEDGLAKKLSWEDIKFLLDIE